MSSQSSVLYQFFDVSQAVSQKVALALDDQFWTYGELVKQTERVVRYLMYTVGIRKGDIVYQYMERSLEMISGVLGIMCVGAVYFPLNPDDPSARICLLINETQGRFVLLHNSTRDRFPSTALKSLLSLNNQTNDDKSICEVDAAYIICTSGTTGRQKAIVHTHSSLLASNTALIQWHLDFYSSRDQVLQVASCSWAMHLLEIFPPLMLGGTLVLLRPGGNLNMAYFTRTIIEQEVTTFTIGGAITRALVDYFTMKNYPVTTFRRLRNLCTVGELMKPQQLSKLMAFLDSSNTRIFAALGLSECNIATACQLSVIDDGSNTIPIGHPLPGYRCLLVDEQGQTISSASNQNEVGQIYIGGSSLFNCYLNNPELTAQMFVTIDNELYMKTGDLARYNARGELVPLGRLDFQIKIRGQRIEIAEVENTIMSSSSEISNCLVVKLSDEEQLLAYIVSSNLQLDTGSIRTYCQKYLRQFMVPNHFIVLEKLPLNSNGKVDRKQLPRPSRKHASDSKIEHKSVIDKVRQLWHSLLNIDDMQDYENTTCFALGGSSLTLMQLFSYYQFYLAPEKQLNILDFFNQPTISKHVHLLTAMETTNDSENTTPTALRVDYMVEGPAAFAQERIWLDEQVRFVSENSFVSTIPAIYNMPLAFVLSLGSSLSLSHLHRALSLLIQKYAILRTCLAISLDDGTLQQRVLPFNIELAPLVVVSRIKNMQEMQRIFVDEQINRTHFDLAAGRVFRCHVIRQSDELDEDLLSSGDMLIFNFHHVAFDGWSEPIFIADFRQAYTTGALDLNDKQTPTYVNYAQWERDSEKNMMSARQFWTANLKDYEPFTLPYDRCPSTSSRTGYGSSIVVELGDGESLLAFARQTQVTAFQLYLSAYYVFLYKLTQCQDLTISSYFANRSRHELDLMIGMFVNILPYRLNVEPRETFGQLIQRIAQMSISAIAHAQLPYQHIVEHYRKTMTGNTNTLPYITTGLQFESRANKINLTKECELVRYTNPSHGAIFDLWLYIEIDECQKLFGSFEYATDLFDEATIDLMARRFECLLSQLFTPSTSSICEFSLLLPHEFKLIHQLTNGSELLHHSNSPIHQAFAYRVKEHPQKLAVIMDNQSLTYAEVLHNSQLLARYLIDVFHVRPHDVVVQCVKRSLEMVIGILSILMCGASYCPLSMDQPLARICSLIEQVQATCVLVHSRTNTYISSNCIDIEKMLSLPGTLNWSDNDVCIAMHSVAYVIFTSISTSTPKAVPITHRNFVTCMNSLVDAAIITHGDTVLQTATQTFDIHMLEILGTLWLGATLCLLRSNSNLNMKYLTAVMQQHEISFFIAVPTLLTSLAHYLHKFAHRNFTLESIRRLCSTGETFRSQTASQLYAYLSSNARLYNLYGLTECTLISTFHLLTRADLISNSLPIGRPLSGYKCRVLDNYLQPVICGHQIGQLFIASEAIFAGYLHQPDLTLKTLIRLPNTEGIFYRTDDLVRIDATSSLLHYVGRKDFQVKLKEQHVELSEIERVVMRTSSYISNCVVVKLDCDNQEHLVAYVQTIADLDMNKLRDECSKQLPLHMVPSLFISVDHFPFNSNGKLDRKALIKSYFYSFQDVQPRTEMEQHIALIWCSVLHLESIPSTNISFFNLGGNSLLLFRLHRIYQTKLERSLDIGHMFRCARIADHASLFEEQRQYVIVDRA